MTTRKTGDDIYDINKYTDKELYDILDLVNPTDRELEAKLYHLIKKYQAIGNESGEKLASFFDDIYAHFFELVDEDEEDISNSIEYPNAASSRESNVVVEKMQNEKQSGNVSTNNANAVTSSANASNTSLTRNLDYSKDYMNPLLKQTITRIISIDSQFRNNKTTTLSTEYSFNLSDTLRDVVALRLNSVHIPKTWYTISKNYGANFFYLKGNTPGIADGNHDYKIAISAGNYSPTELIDTINISIEDIKNTYTDVSFGKTEIKYNSNTCRAKTIVDITKTYTETSYSCYFPNFSYSMIDGINGDYLTIPSMLGYNSQNYNIGAIYSSRTVDASLVYNTSFYLDASNNYFTIVQYDGSVINYDNGTTSYNVLYDYSYTAAIYDTITITSSLNIGLSYKGSDIIDDFNTQLMSSADLSGSYLELVQITDVSAVDFGNSYFSMFIHLNPKTTKNAVNSKTVVIFPSNDTNVWLTSSSCFQFTQSYNEISNIVGENTTYISDYFIGDNVYFTLKCTKSGYDDGLNDYQIDLSSGNYSLKEYISHINSQLFNAEEIYSSIGNINIDNFIINSVSDYCLRMRLYISRIFSTDMYCIDTSDGFFDTDFRFYLSNQELTTDASFSSTFYTRTNYLIKRNQLLFTVYPNPNSSYGNKNAAPFYVTYTYDRAYLSLIDLLHNINSSIQTWTDPILNIQPFSNTQIIVTPSSDNETINCKLFVNIEVELKTTDYSIEFFDPSGSWQNYLYLDTSYNFSQSIKSASFIYNNEQYDVSYCEITGSTKIYSNIITLYDGSNNYFYLNPIGDGVSDSTNANRIKIMIDASANGTNYTRDDLINAIQAKFDSVIAGSNIWFDTTLEKTVMRINASKVYRTSDYKIVFYDPYSFVKCYIGATSVRNTSWDTTIGWILGYRQLTEYPLGSSYISVDANDTSIIYYDTTNSIYNFDTSSNIATLQGDTSVSVNLYNYFMIVLNDYTQNQLNDGIVTIAPSENIISSTSYANRAALRCDPVTGDKIFVGTTTHSGNQNTEKEIYAANQKLLSKKSTVKKYSNAPYTQDIFALVPLSVSNLANGAVFVDTGSSLTKHERMYFGPVNISRMTIKLVDDRGNILDLNGSDWSCSIQCDQLYQQKSI